MRQFVFTSFRDFQKRKEIFRRVVHTEVARIDSSVRNRRHTEGTERRRTGKVYLVGAGPGDPELITLKGKRALELADVVAYDSLVSEELLDHAPIDAERIHVGKSVGTSCMKQKDINEILVRKAREGKTVVRLKGGDPFIFGRGAEELEALNLAGIQGEVIPGITAGTGIPTSLGIPLTHRTYASSVVFATGHEDPEKGEERIDWNKLTSADTIVVYMGLRRLPALIDRWLEAGRQPSTLVCVILSGTLRQEAVFTGTINTIASRMIEMPPNAPGLIIVGEVVDYYLKNRSILAPARLQGTV
jgi:uroporphyrin-III C-methyltransferase